MGVTAEVYNILKERLDGKQYPADTKFPSGGKIAAEFGINKMTANKIIAMLIGEGYLYRKGFSGNGTLVADFQHKSSGNMLAILCAITPYSSRVLQGVIHGAASNDFLLVLESPTAANLQKRIQMLREKNIRSIICIGCGVPELPPDMKMICIDIPNPPATHPANVRFINSDNYQGGFAIMSEILRRGHREVLIFSSERFVISQTYPVSPRIRGMRDAMEQYRISDAEDRIFYAMPHSLPDTRKFLKTYLKRFPATSLIAADSDTSANMIAEACSGLGISCPGKIALTGFGNVTSLPISTVDQNAEYQGRLAAQHLIRLQLAGIPFPDESSEVELVETKLVNTDCIPILLHR